MSELVWRRLGDVLDASWALLSALWRPFGGVPGALWGISEALEPPRRAKTAQDGANMRQDVAETVNMLLPERVNMLRDVSQTLHKDYLFGRERASERSERSDSGPRKHVFRDFREVHGNRRKEHDITGKT